MAGNLSKNLTKLKQSRRDQSLISGLCRLATVNLIVVAIAFALDNLAGLSAGSRLVWLTLWGTVNLYLLVKLVRTMLQSRLTDKQAAMELEKLHGIKDNLLVNTVCFNQDNTVSDSLRKMFKDSADASCEKISVPGLWQNSACRKGLKLLGIVLVVALFYFIPFHRFAGNAFARFVQPWGQLASLNFTQFQVSPGDVVISQGGNLKVTAEAARDGQRINNLKILVKGSGSPTLYPMDMLGGRSEFVLKNITNSLTYSILAGGDSSPEFTVSVSRKPEFKKFSVTVTPPSYTGLKTEVYTAAVREISAPADSIVTIDATPPEKMKCGLIIDGGEKEFPGKFALTKNLSASASIRGIGGVVYDNSWSCDFKMLNDKAPQVRFLNRETNIEAGFGQTIPLYFSAEDDFGIDRLAVMISIKDQKLKIKEFKYERPLRTQLREAYQLKISPKIFPPDSSVEINIVAFDSHSPAQTGITPVPLTIHIVDLVEKLKETTEQSKEKNLYELLFKTVNQQQTTRNWLSAQVKNFAKWKCRQLTQDQSTIRNLLQKAALEADTLARDKQIKQTFANEITLLKNDLAEKIEQRSQSVVTKWPDSKLKIELNEIVLMQTKLIERLQKLLGALAVVQQQELQQEKQAKEDEQEKELYDQMKALKDKTDNFIKEQKKIIKQTEAIDPKDADDWSDQEEKLLGDLAARETDFAKFFKAAFNDLSKKQNQDFSNSAMADEFIEMYEELQKAGDALNKKKIEIATLAENTAMNSSVAVAANLDRWLSDKKDNVKWIAEEDGKAADTNLTDLPSELTDIIGDLIETEEEMGEDTQDSSNSFNYSSDDGLGWGVGDGNIDSMQAKGITGNIMPNNNEVGGRSGEGRSGKSSGQFVEKEATGKGGRKTPTRLTQSPYEKGVVDDKSKDAQGGASGGGKQSGTGDEGLTGVTPDQDQDTGQRLAGNQGELRQRALSLLRKLNERNLPSGDLSEAVRKMSMLEQPGMTAQNVDIRRVKSEIAAALKNARTAVDMAVKAEQETVRQRKGQTFTVKYQQQEKVPDGYEDYVDRYFKALASEQQ